MATRRRLGPLDPIFDDTWREGAIQVGNTEPVELPPIVVDKISQVTGAGTSGFSRNVPVGAVDGDVCVMIVKHDDAFATLTTGLTLEEQWNYSLSNLISVLTLVYDSGTHGPPGSSIGGTYTATGVTRMYSWWIRNIGSDPQSFANSTPSGSDSDLVGTIAPAPGMTFGFVVVASALTFDDLRGWDLDYDGLSEGDPSPLMFAISKVIDDDGIGAVQGPQVDSISNIYNAAFALVTI